MSQRKLIPARRHAQSPSVWRGISTYTRIDEDDPIYAPRLGGQEVCQRRGTKPGHDATKVRRRTFKGHLTSLQIEGWTVWPELKTISFTNWRGVDNSCQQSRVPSTNNGMIFRQSKYLTSWHDLSGYSSLKQSSEGRTKCSLIKRTRLSSWPFVSLSNNTNNKKETGRRPFSS